MFKESHLGTTAGYWHMALLFVGITRAGRAGQWLLGKGVLLRLADVSLALLILVLTNLELFRSGLAYATPAREFFVLLLFCSIK